MKSYRKRLIWICALASVIFWFGDALLDKFIKFPNEPFVKILIFDAPTHEFIARIFVVILIVCLVVTILFYINKVEEVAVHKPYHTLFENIRDAAFLMPAGDLESFDKFSRVNSMTCKMLGYGPDECQQLSLPDIIIKGKWHELSQMLKKLRSEGEVVVETILMGKEGREIPVEMIAQMMEWRGESTVLCLARDISERLQKEQEIRRLASFPQINPNPIIEVNPDGVITFANVAGKELIRNLGIKDLQVFFPEDLLEMIKTAKETGVNRFYREVMFGGALFSEFIHYVPQFEVVRIHPGEITAQRRAEEALQESEKQLRILNAHLLTIQDAERWRISRELHDEMGQSLMFVKFQLTSIQHRLSQDQEKLRKDCGDLLSYLDGLIENIRRLIHELSPTVLEELGLSSSLKFLLNEFAERYKINESSIRINEIDELFSGQAGINIYRIFQEITLISASTPRPPRYLWQLKDVIIRFFFDPG